jgi:hypothetical protein
MKFELNEQERNAVCVFIDQHEPVCRLENEYLGAIGGRWIYEIIGTSIGDILNLKCACGERCCLNALDL